MNFGEDEPIQIISYFINNIKSKQVIPRAIIQTI